MKSYTWKRVWVAFITVVITLLGLASPALALNGHPVEGVHYKIVKGNNPSSTYLKAMPGVNINTPLLAETFHTTPHDIRADNPTKTIALCHVRGGYRGKVVGESIAERVRNRASSRYWVDCPEKDQYVFIVPGELIELTGVKHLSFNVEQKLLAELKACAAAACVLDKAKALGAKAADSHEEVTQLPLVEIEDVPPPAGQENAAALTVLMRRLSAALDHADQADKRFWYSIIFAGLVLLLAIGIGISRRSWISRFDDLQSEKDSLLSMKYSLRDSLQFNKKARTEALEEQRKELEAGRAEMEKSLEEKGRLLKARDAELVTIRASADTLRTLLNSKETESRQWRQRLAQFLSDVHVRTRGATLHVADGSDLVAESQEALAYLEACDGELRTAILRLGQIVDGQGPVTQTRPFDLTRFHEINDMLALASDETGAFCDGDVITLLDRIRVCNSDSALSRMRAALEQKTLQIALLKTDPPPPRDDAEEYGKLLAESARLAAENARLTVENGRFAEEKSQLERQVEDLENQVTNLIGPERQAPVTAPFPELPRPSQPPVIDQYRNAEPSVSGVVTREECEPEDVTQPKAQAVTGKSTLTPPDHRVSHLDMRSEKRISAYNGLREWVDLYEGQVWCAIEHDSELAILQSLAASLKNRRFQCFNERSTNESFGIMDLLDGQYARSLSAAPRSVG